MKSWHGLMMMMLAVAQPRFPTNRPNILSRCRLAFGHPFFFPPEEEKKLHKTIFLKIQLLASGLMLVWWWMTLFKLA